MVTKLTLKLKKKVIDKAKQYASDHDTSLSRLIENYLSAITSGSNSESDISPLVKSLSGIIALPSDTNHEKEYNHHLTEKYL
jgi:hypothetical protein